MTELASDFEVSESGIKSTLKTGYWAAVASFILAVVFLAAVAASFIALKGPPVGIFLTLTSVVTLIGAVVMVLLW